MKRVTHAYAGLIVCLGSPAWTHAAVAPASPGGPGSAVDVFPGSEAAPRNSEGSIIALSGGRLLLTSTRFYGGRADHSEAHIAAITSDDGGRTWSEPVVVQKNVGKKNVMSASLARLQAPASAGDAGPIGLFYLVKNGDDDLKVYVRTSRDEGKSWSEPVCVTNRPGYHVMNNDRVRRLRSGRLLCPVAFTADSRKVNHYRSLCFISDDAGKTWRAGRGDVGAPKRGAMEPEVIERNDGTLLMLVRTQLGRNYAATSSDGGDTWSKAEPFGPSAPEAPSTLRRISSTGDWLLIFNDSIDPKHHHHGTRTPLTAAVSTDEGRTWKHQRNIETRKDQTYAYTSLIFVGDRAVMSYYVSNNKTGRLSLRFRSVPIDWFYGSGASTAK